MESSRDIIIQTDKFAEAVHFYKNVLRLPITHQSEKLVGFETGSFCLYVEPGVFAWPGLRILCCGRGGGQERTSPCRMSRRAGRSLRSTLLSA